MLPKQFEISFDFKPTKFIGGWTNVLHLTTKANCCGYGSRIPGVFIMYGRIHFTFSLSGNGNYHTQSGKLALNKWYHFRVTQTLKGNKYIYTVYMNKKVLVTKVNTKPLDFKNVKVFVADNFFNAQPGYVKNLKIYGKCWLFAFDDFIFQCRFTNVFIFYYNDFNTAVFSF